MWKTGSLSSLFVGPMAGGKRGGDGSREGGRISPRRTAARRDLRTLPGESVVGDESPLPEAAA